MEKTPEQMIVDIIKSELALDGGSVWVHSQNRLIPPTDELFVIVGMVDSKIISSRTELVDDSEKQIVQSLETIQIDIMSRNNDALSRRWEIVAALKSFYSQHVQEKHCFKISRIPNSFLNTSAAEGGSNINRFTLTFPVFSWYEKIKSSADYFANFGLRVDDEKTIGTDKPIVDFEISGGV